ncbi:MAG TPA: sigma-70 family RNA polymerase sigma factor [Acidimicrobiia bacterium]
MEPTLNHDFHAQIEQHLPLVRHIVYQVSVHFPSHVDRTELTRAGVLGLVQAARRYDAVRGVPFQRFAAQRIRGAILDAVRSADWAPRSLRRSAREVETVSGQLANDLGRAPSSAETAAALGMTVRQLAVLQEQLSRSVVLTLDMALAEAGDDEEITIVDTVADRSADASEELETRELHAYLRDAVALLPERHRVVIEGYFFGGRTSEELAEELGVCVSRVSQLRSDAFEMLRQGVSAQFAEPGAVADTDVRPTRTAQRRSAYAAAIAARSTWKARIEAQASRAATPLGAA